MNQVITDPSLTIQAKGLYALLSCYADKNRSCYPSLSTLADNLNVTPCLLYTSDAADE